MKPNKRMLWVIVLLALSAIAMESCSPKSKKEDAKEMATVSNEKKFDDSIKEDTEFAVGAADGGLLEVKLGELAQTNAASGVVKKFGRTMIEEHSKANGELQALSSQKNISIPLSLSAKNQEHYDDLSKKTGKDFDKAYVDFMVKDHGEDIDDFKKEAEKGTDPDLKSWAAGKLGTLEHHLQMAKEAQETVKNNNGK